MYLIFQISVFALAVFGFYCLIRAIWGYFTADSSISVCVKVDSERELLNLDMLLSEAGGTCFFERKKIVVMLCGKAIDVINENDSAYADFLCTVREFGASVCVPYPFDREK